MASLQNAALLLLLALAVPCVALADNGSCEGSSPDYSYLALTLQWPLSNGCSDCGSDTPWTIHGMCHAASCHGPLPHHVTNCCWL